MALDGLAREAFDMLPLEEQKRVEDFIMFLSNRSLQQDKKSFPFDAFAVGMAYIADDFDVTPEGFEDYM